MQFTPRHLTRIREIWEVFSQSYNSYSDESPGSKVMGPDQFVVAASQLMEEARREALKEMDGRWMDFWAEFGTLGRPNGKHASELSKDIMALRKEFIN